MARNFVSMNEMNEKTSVKLHSVHIRLARTASVVSLKFEFKQHSLNFNPPCLKKIDG